MKKLILCYFLLTIIGNIYSNDHLLNSVATNIKEEDSLYLNFEDASLANVVEYIANKKKINLIPSTSLINQKITLTTHAPFSLDRAWDILMTLLESSGFSIINVDSIYRIIPKNEAPKQPLPSYLGVDYQKLPDSDLKIRFVYLFKNIVVDSVKPILDSLLGSNNIKISSNLNTCIITEKCNNIKAAMRIINELDSGGLRESIQIIKLKEADAENVAEIFNSEIFDSENKDQKNARIFMPKSRKSSTCFNSSTRIIPDTRNNNLILLGTKDNLDKIKKFINQNIDVPLRAPESRLHIKELKYTQAKKIKVIIESIIKSLTKDVKFKYFEDVKITSEEAVDHKTSKVGTVGAGNRLVIACNKEDWNRIEQFIDQIDKPQPQVAIEVLFVDITLEDSRELSAQLRNKASTLGKHVDYQSQNMEGTPTSFDTNLRTNLLNAASINDNASYMTLGKDFDVYGVLKGVLNNQHNSIVSQPYLVANNHQKCKLEVSEERQVTGKESGESNSALIAQEDIKATTEVEITPGINSDGVISLLINLSLNEFISTTVTNADRTNNFLNTLTTMKDGEVLVIGGLTKIKTVSTHNKTPGLSKIPIIGNLFKGKTKETTKTNLFIFIRPTLIKPKFEGDPGDYTKLKLDYARLAIGKHESLEYSKDPIQKWFFNTPAKPSTLVDGTSKNTSDEIKHIEDYIIGKYQPRSVVIPIDKYYKTETSRTIERLHGIELKREGAKPRKPKLKKSKVITKNKQRKN